MPNASNPGNAISLRPASSRRRMYAAERSALQRNGLSPGNTSLIAVFTKPGRMTVTPTVARQQRAHGIAVGLDCGLARAIGRRDRHAAQRGDRTDHRDSSAPALAHPVDDRQDRMQCAVEIRIDDASRTLQAFPVARIGDRAGHAGVRDQEVDRVTGIEIGQPGGNRRGIAHVDRARIDRGAARPAGRRRLLDLGKIAADDAERRARLRIGKRKRTARPALAPVMTMFRGS